MNQADSLLFREQIQNLAIEAEISAVERYPEGRGNEDIAKEVDRLFDRAIILKAFLELIDDMRKEGYEFTKIELRPFEIAIPLP